MRIFLEDLKGVRLVQHGFGRGERAELQAFHLMSLLLPNLTGL